MPRKVVSIQDILDAIGTVQKYTQGWNSRPSLGIGEPLMRWSETNNRGEAAVYVRK
ncbi:MAG: hypothetical protein SRB2_01916 [Desulfobacteraceae bacterium Eth-SRB2]|nr:MAG: hypothetical protein SRB2_01916 [Desulfobacteraceae bacterium Eth-SRB2]